MQARIKKQVIYRLRRISGQIQGLTRMIEKDRYCIDIIYQSLAVKQALSGFEDFILENHLKIHVEEQFKSGRSKKAIKEILSIYKFSKRK